MNQPRPEREQFAQAGAVGVVDDMRLPAAVSQVSDPFTHGEARTRARHDGRHQGPLGSQALGRW